MEKIKNILRPGHAKDDEVMYGTTEAQPSAPGPSTSTSQPTTTTDESVPHLTTDESTKKEHGVLRQILNPGGQKYDETAYGITAHETPANQGTTLQTDPEVQKHEHGVLRQILNPGGEKYDEVRYGTTAHADEPLNVATTGTPVSKLDLPDVEGSAPIEDKHGVAHQVLNPGGDKFDELRYGEDPAVAAHRASIAGDNSTSHVGRDAALGGAAIGGAGLATHEATKAQDPSTTTSAPATSTPAYTQPTTTWAPATTTPVASHPITTTTNTQQGDRAFPLSGGTTTTGTSSTAPTGTSTVPTGTSTGTEDSHLGRDAAIGAGVGAAGVGAYEANKSHESTNESVDISKQGHEPHRWSILNKLDPRVKTDKTGKSEKSEKTDSTPIAGGAAIASASTAAPIPSGTAPVSSSTAPITSSTAPVASSTVPVTSSTSAAPISSTTAAGIPSNTTQPESHLGRDAAIGAGAVSAGAVGAGALASHKSEQEPQDDVSRATYTARSQYIGGGDPASSKLHTGDELASSGLTAPLASSNEPLVIGSTSATPVATGTTYSQTETIDPALAAYEKSLEPKSDVSAATYTYSAVPVGSHPLHNPNEKPAEGYVHHTSGPHALDIANRLDPHVPGEFPTESGLDRHDGRLENREAGIVEGAGIGALAGTVTSASDIPSLSSTAGPTSTQRESRLGRDAALGAGAGASIAGIGAHEASKHDTSTAPASTVPATTATTTSSAPVAGGPAGLTSSSHTQPLTDRTLASTEAPIGGNTTQNDSHLGRDAAIGAGTGAAGIAAYEAGKSHSETGTAAGATGTTTESSTTGSTVPPHNSSLLNKLDPRVKTDSTATGSHEPSTSHDSSYPAGTSSVTGATGSSTTSTDPAVIAAREATARHSEHNKLHKSDDPRGPTGATNIMHEHHEQKLREAREAEAAKHAPGAEKERKPSLIQRILHPGHHSKDHNENSNVVNSPLDTETPTSRTHIGNEPYGATSGTVIEPHTGLPANVGQYGTGAGGTDGSSTIPGVHGTSSSTTN